MEVSEINIGERGWYVGDLRTDGDDYELSSGGSTADVTLSDDRSDLLDQVWYDQARNDYSVMLKGTLHAEESSIMGNYSFEINDVEAAGIVIEEDFSGWTVGISEYDLIFTRPEHISEDKNFRAYANQDLEGLKQDLDMWLDKSEEVANQVEDLPYEMENWPWKPKSVSS